MDMIEIPDEIARLEERIEALRENRAHSARIALASRVVAAAGGLWLAAGILRLVPLEENGLVFGIAAVIGGIVLAGSSQGTIREVDAAIAKAIEARSSLIDIIDPEPVSVPELANVIPLRPRRSAGGPGR